MDEKSMAPAVHGALDYAELARLGIDPAHLVDLSVNSNPYGPSPRVRPALASVPLDRYPDRDCLALREQIQTYEPGATDIVQEAILCGNGASELIHIVARALLHAGDTAAIIGPTFGEYRVASQLAGATVISYTTRAEEQFALDLTACCAWLTEKRPAVLWLCNPDNPTGRWFSRSELEALLDCCQRCGIALVIDEVYWHFLVPHATYAASELLTRDHKVPVIVLRSLTKAYSLAGLRLGYLLARPEVAARLRPFLPAWNVNAFAQAAGIAALADQTYLEETLTRLAQERDAFWRALAQHGIASIPSRTHYGLLAVGDAHRIRHELLRRGYLVRDCSSFGLPDLIRVATPQRSVWVPFVEVLSELV